MGEGKIPRKGSYRCASTCIRFFRGQFLSGHRLWEVTFVRHKVSGDFFYEQCITFDQRVNKEWPLIKNCDFCTLKFMKTCLAMVGFWSLFWKNFPQPKFYTRSTAIPRFVYRESTHLSVR